MMKKYLSAILAVAALTGFGQPLLAAKPEKKKGGGSAKHAAAAQVQHAKHENKKGSGSAKHAAVAQVQHAKVSRGKAAGQRFAASNQGSVARNEVRAQQTRSVSPSVSEAQRSVVRDRARIAQSNTPTVAVGGSQFRNTRVESREFRDRSDYRYYRPPGDVYRDWNRSRTYTWNRHRYHWYDGAWVILNGNVGYDYPGYDYPTSYLYRDAPSGSLVAQVQARLARDGYEPGPIDGIIGSQTRDAIADFQSDYGLPVTGRIDDSLVHALGL